MSLHVESTPSKIRSNTLKLVFASTPAGWLRAPSGAWYPPGTLVPFRVPVHLTPLVDPGWAGLRLAVQILWATLRGRELRLTVTGEVEYTLSTEIAPPPTV